MANMSISEPMYGLLFDGRELRAVGPMVYTRFGKEPCDYSIMIRRGHANVSLPGSFRLHFMPTEIPSIN